MAAGGKRPTVSGGRPVVADDGAADVGLVVLVSAMTVSIVPFIKSMATKAGEDAYQSVKRLLNKSVKPGEVGHVKILDLADSDRHLHVHLSSVLSKDGAAQLFRLDLDDPRIHDGDILYDITWHFLSQDSHLSWHDEQREWADRPEPNPSRARDILLRRVYDDRDLPRRITVALIRQASEALERLERNNNLSKTDIINRAISLYDFIDEQIRSGQDILVRDKDTGDVQVIRFL